ncbi:hypothetical protein Aple_058490 [Acrocarpospora pleiomorpha]|uniref:Uncharacterized protein n=1 Tax=Acrocarpospora pleiomorpha TaxID=90975 RepID=A0A5M3XQ43_9ACTN|nr:hypothetical protein Aple_058490 [Acrocarpospora pleiomorpha]
MPGKNTIPATVWSASQGCVASDRRPVSTTPSESARPTAAPRRGCFVAARPAAVTFPAPALALPSGQNHWCWKA